MNHLVHSINRHKAWTDDISIVPLSPNDFQGALPKPQLSRKAQTHLVKSNKPQSIHICVFTFYKNSFTFIELFLELPKLEYFSFFFLDFSQPFPDHISESQQSYALPLRQPSPFFIQDLMLTSSLTAQSVPFQLTNMNNLFSIIFTVLQDYSLKV